MWPTELARWLLVVALARFARCEVVAVDALGARDRLVYVRVPKSGSKTMVALLQSGWLFGGDEGVLNTGCHAHEWLGNWQQACGHGAGLLRRVLNNSASRMGASLEAAARDSMLSRGLTPPSSDDPRRACAFSAHCSIAPLVHGAASVVADAGLRLRFLTTVRDPVRRVLSEYRHVCAGGAWDYAARCQPDCQQYTLRGRTHPPNSRAREGSKCESDAAIREFVSQVSHANGMRNRQAQFMSGVTAHPCGKAATCGVRHDARGLRGARPSRGRADSSLDALLLNVSALDVSQEELASRAIANMNRFDAVFVVERFALSLAVASRRFGVRAPRAYSVVQEPLEGKFEVDAASVGPELLAFLRKQNSADVALRAAAEKKLERDAVVLFGSLEAADACARYECTSVERVWLRFGGMGFTEKRCDAAFDQVACAPP